MPRGRPYKKEPKKVPLNVSLEAATIDRINLHVTLTKRKRSEIVDTAVNEHLDKRERREDA